MVLYYIIIIIIETRRDENTKRKKIEKTGKIGKNEYYNIYYKR